MSENEKVRVVKVPAAPSKDSAYAALNGVSIDWLRRAFHMSSAQVRRKMKGCRVMASSSQGVALYDLGEAAERLVKPKMDLNEYLEDITVENLPDRLKETFWNAKLKEQRYLKNAGELWRTEAVIQLFGSVLKDAKERMRLISDLAEKELGLNPDQINGLREIVNSIQGQIYDSIMKMESQTPSSVAELNREYGNDEPDYISETVVSDDDFEY